MSAYRQAPVMQARVDLSTCNTQDQQSLIGSTQNSVDPEAGMGVSVRTCYLCEPIGSRRYARKGDLTRHIKTVHGAPSRFLCHVHQCPRSIPGQGFARKDKLVDHLKTSKPDHSLTHRDAVYQAAYNNMARGDGVPQATSLRASNQSASQQYALSSTLPENSIANDSLEASGYNPVIYNPALHNATMDNDIVHGVPNRNVNGHAVNPSVLAGRFYGNAIDPAPTDYTFDAYTEAPTASNSALSLETSHNLMDNMHWH